MITAGRCLVARVSGEMDYLTEPVFRPQFKELIARGDRLSCWTCPASPSATQRD
jgi:hypothetical protein